MPRKISEKSAPDRTSADALAQQVNSIWSDDPSESRETEKTDSQQSANAKKQNSTISLNPDSPSSVTGSRQTTGTSPAATPPAAPRSAASSPARLRVPEAHEDDGPKDRIPAPYVPAELSYDLQQVQVELRRLTGEKISMSLIIECALSICLFDYVERGPASALAEMVSETHKRRWSGD